MLESTGEIIIVCLFYIVLIRRLAGSWAALTPLKDDQERECWSSFAFSSQKESSFIVLTLYGQHLPQL